MIGIVILNYRTWDMTKRCVESITDHPPQKSYRIFLVDNHSPNRPGYSLELLVDKYHIRLIRNERNLGYNGGNNVGIRAALKAGCDAVLFANNDIVFRRGCIQSLYEGLLGADGKTGITCPKILEKDGRIHRYHMMYRMTMLDKYLVATKLNILFRKRYRSYYGWDRDYGKSFYVFAAQGSCVMMSAECAKAVMPFDEVPLLYEEEQMLGIRVEKKGYRERYVPEAEVWHLHGGSTREVKGFSFAHNVRSEVYFCRKYLHAKKWQILPLYWYRMMLYFLRCIRSRDFRKNIRAFFRISLNDGKIIGEE